MMTTLATMSATRLPLALLAPLVLFAAAPVHGAEPVEGLRSMAMGSSLRGAATGAEGVLLNPSGIALVHQYAVTGFYSFRLQQLGHAVHVSIADSVTQRRLAMGLYYTFLRETPQVGLQVAEGEVPGARIVPIRDQRLTRNGHEVGLLTGIPLGDRFMLGLTTKYGYFSTTAQLEQLPADFVSTNPRIDKDRVYDLGSVSNVVSFDVGMTIRATERFTIGVVGQNLWGHGSEMPTLIGGGLALVLGQRLTVAADVLVNLTGYQTCAAMEPDPCNLRNLPDQPAPSNRVTVRAGGGAEYAIADKVPLRAGYLYDSGQGGHHISAGLGYFSPRYAIDFAMRQRLSAGPETVLVLGFRIFRD